MALMLDEELDENVTTIKVIGVGGGGGNAVNRMVSDAMARMSRNSTSPILIGLFPLSSELFQGGISPYRFSIASVARQFKHPTLSPGFCRRLPPFSSSFLPKPFLPC